ncbi:MAG: TonB-dependent receptor [Rhodocyclaceae bacterium]|nr:TonB-dependent receptor [Rhodocyclaceae bacterium]
MCDPVVKQGFLRGFDGQTAVGFQRRSRSQLESHRLEARARCQLTADILAYGTVATGFKSGGYNGRATTAAAITPRSMPGNRARSPRLSLKTMLANGRVRLNIDYYRNQYNKLQLTAFDANGAAIYTNAADAIIKGWEAEAAVQITAQWSANFNLGTIDAHYLNYSDVNKGGFRRRGLEAGAQAAMGLGTSYRHPIGGGVVALTAQAKRNAGDHFQNLANSAVRKTKAYNTVDARIAYEARNWSVGAPGAKNLTDKQYIAGAFPICQARRRRCLYQYATDGRSRCKLQVLVTPARLIVGVLMRRDRTRAGEYSARSMSSAMVSKNAAGCRAPGQRRQRRRRSSRGQRSRGGR